MSFAAPEAAAPAPVVQPVPAATDEIASAPDVPEILAVTFEGLSRLADENHRVATGSDSTLQKRVEASTVEALTLIDSGQLARGRSYTLAAADARVDESKYLARSAIGGLLPRVDLRNARGREKSSPASVLDVSTGQPKETDTHPRNESFVSLVQPLFDPAAVAEVLRTRSIREANEASRSASRQDNGYEAVSAYFNLVQYGLLLDLAQQQTARMTRLFEWINARAEAGGASGADRERIRGRVLSAKVASDEARGSLDQALISFAKLTGVMPASVEVPLKVGNQPAMSLAEAVEVARLENPDVVTARANTEAARYERRGAQSRFLPKVTLELSQNKVQNAGGALGWQTDKRAFVVLTMPLFNGGSDFHQQLAVASREDAYRYAGLEAERTAEQNLNIAYSAIRASGAKLASVRRQLIANQKVVAAYDDQKVNANRSLLDVLDANQQLFNSQVDLVRTSVATALLYYQILRITGRLDAAIASPGSSE